ncbi:glycosyltransferase family 39 protein [Rhodoplanes sp. TEM]|uniref:Glycosyltransferase family 39 protein n=2 Tax=Nitrobacteraceae TaxID=41294 RepID=A0ABT5JIT2_RHOTP|nr:MULTISPECIES: glycosyltransferase family 39 protein [Rhodoplanes]MDC7788930.1 glycosyltransferase family 39 protein [Rhodoplanes tepidamans]MDC7987247.1 glycosyltransferase family 39 protein [Rhodoplanes sp. TEM]MDQ0358623.1 4-amino-4-deoxy-L-arabinose transferase-like glycosyltransferase [Rhodoplanes tepidamans]
MISDAPVRRAGPRALHPADIAAVVVLVVVCAVSLATFRDFGMGWDDYAHAEYGGLLLRLYGSGFTDRRALSFVNLYAYGGGFDMLAALAAKVLPFPIFETRRLVGAIIGIAGLAMTWRIARRLGGPLAGFVGVALLATCPLYVGHMFINPKDVPFAVAMLAATLGFVRAFSEYPHPTVPTTALLGLGLGLSFGTRVMGALAAVPTAAAFLLIVVAEARRQGVRPALWRAGEFLLRLLPAVVVAYALMALIWPWSVVSPLNPVKALLYFSHFFEKPWRELFEGELLWVVDMPRRYVPELFALTTPEIFWALGIAGVVAALASAAHADRPLNRRASLVFLAVSVVFPIAFTVLTRPAMYNGLRHFVFVLPPAAVLGGLVGALLANRVAASEGRRTAIAAAVLAVTLAHPVVTMIRIHPYQYTYFNATAGGLQGADGRYMRDYWGLSMKQASLALRDVLAARGELATPKHKRHIAICGPQRPVRVELGRNYPTDWQPQGGEFAISLNEFYCAKLDAPVLAEVVRDGVVYARVYDIRGRTIDTLLTPMPP